MHVSLNSGSRPVKVLDGPYEGHTLVKLHFRVYLTPEEAKKYEGAESIELHLRDEPRSGFVAPDQSNSE